MQATIAMAVISMAASSKARDQLELAGIVERRRLEAGDEEGREALQHELFVVGRGHLRQHLQRIRSGERIRERAHHEVQAPRELLLREVRQRAQERLLVAMD